MNLYCFLKLLWFTQNHFVPHFILVVLYLISALTSLFQCIEENIVELVLLQKGKAQESQKQETNIVEDKEYQIQSETKRYRGDVWKELKQIYGFDLQ